MLHAQNDEWENCRPVWVVRESLNCLLCQLSHHGPRAFVDKTT